MDGKLSESQNAILKAIALGTPMELVLMDITKAIDLVCIDWKSNIQIINRRTNTFSMAFASSLPSSLLRRMEGIKVSSSEVSFARAASLHKNVADTKLNQYGACYVKEAINLHGFTSSWSLPILNDEEVVIGCITLFSEVLREPTKEEESLVEPFKDLASISISKEEAKKKVKKLSNTLEAGKFVASSIMDMVTIKDPQGRILYASPYAEQLLGYSPDALIGVVGNDLVYEEDKPALQAFMEKLLTTKMPQTVECRMKHKDGTLVYIESKAKPILNDQNEVFQYVSIARDISERKKTEKMIEHIAFHDSLTGLPNRRYLFHLMNEKIMESKTKKHKLAILFLDLDRIKSINDVYGHHAGDTVLIEISKRLKQDACHDTLLSRWGGDEFLVVLHDKDRSRVEEKAQEIIESVQKPIFLDQKQSLSVTVSIGISFYPDHGHNVDILINKADAAMYNSKDHGKNTFTVFSEEMDKAFKTRIFVESELRKAIKKNEFTLWYQPKVCASSKNIIGVEALIRWIHPIHGLIAPGDFIPLAEDTGLIHSIGKWVLLEACHQIKKWQSEGMKVSINLSAKQLQDPSIIQTIEKVLKDTEIDPGLLEIEITESAMVNNVELTISILKEIKSMGVSLSVDDFGKSYSSLNYIKQFPVDRVKIDRSFIRDLSTLSRDKEIVLSIIQLARRLGLHSLAEGVETEAQHELLQQMGCDELQGYYFAMPMPAETFEQQYILPLKKTKDGILEVNK